MNEITYIPGEIDTFSGKQINVFEPDPKSICIEDIAHSLSHQCRFGGHTSRFYSVAEHSVYCTAVVPEKHKLAALMHDASEAYLIDLPSPIKILMPDYIDAEDRIMKVIAEKFGFEYPLHDVIKKADKLWLEFEWKGLILNKVGFPTLPPADAKRYFLKRFHELTK